MFNQIKQGISNIGNDLSYGANLLGSQGQLNQQYNKLVKPAPVIKKQAMATKMKKPSIGSTFMSGATKDLTGNYPSYLQ